MVASKISTSKNMVAAQAGARRCVVVRAEKAKNTEATPAPLMTTRRAAFGLFAGASVLAGNAAPSLAAYGEAANVFGGKTGNFSGFTPFEGDGYSLQLPAKWNPSKEKIFAGTDLR